MRIWDLRRGDAVDDRTSLPGRSLLSVVFAAALEFNFLQASVGLLALIIGPALLVGLAPSVVVTYGRLTIQAAASAGDSLLVALVLVAVLVGVALWVGRPLLAIAVDNFWHLHYTLVFPLFVAVRELLRALVEWWRGCSIPPDQLERGRRLATVLAALLLGGGGLMLAVLVDVSLGLQLVDVTHVRVWTVAQGPWAMRRWSSAS
jgi:hypothetical protein